MYPISRWRLNRPHPGHNADIDKLFKTDIPAHRDCLQAFVMAQDELVKMHTEIGNTAVNEYNEFVTEMNKKNADSTK